MKKLYYFLIALAVVTGVTGFMLFTGVIRFNYPDRTKYPVMGIDISHHQGKIDWDKLKSESISFVIIKATEGGDYVDPLFQENWASSLANNYKTGAYHFYRFCTDPQLQARNFIETVPNRPDLIAPTIDLEFGGNCDINISDEKLLAEIQQFMDIIESHYGKKPIIYATIEFYERFMINKFRDYPLWIRNIFAEPTLPNNREWQIWQFANRAHLEGIDMYVDLNVLNGSSVNDLP